jgi:hypothetical protein
MHGMASVGWKPAEPAMLRNFRGTGDTSSKSIFVKEKMIPPGVRERAVAGAQIWLLLSKAMGLNHCPGSERDRRTLESERRRPRRSSVNPPIIFLNHDRASRGLRLVPVGSCTQKTLAIDR